MSIRPRAATLALWLSLCAVPPAAPAAPGDQPLAGSHVGAAHEAGEPDAPDEGEPGRARPAQASRHLLIVQGLGGEPFYDELFSSWSQSLIEIAEQQLGFARAQVVYLAPDGVGTADHRGGAPRADGLALKSRVAEALRELAARGAEGDLLAVVLIGHGTARDGRALFNLPGPDLSATELATLLDALPPRRLLVINTASSSGPFAQALAGPQRIIITATASGAENNHAHFGGHFVQSLVAPAADADKDGRISVLEAFRLARRRVERAYADDQRLLTEHALLEDDGDGVGTRDPQASSGDGTLAATVFMRAAPLDPADPGAAQRLTLEVQARELVARIARLKRGRALMREQAFETELESLLVALALNRRALRQAGSP